MNSRFTQPGIRWLTTAVLPFQLESSGARGRLIRLANSVDEILGKHD